jgi:hypothetical protein
MNGPDRAAAIFTDARGPLSAIEAVELALGSRARPPFGRMTCGAASVPSGATMIATAPCLIPAGPLAERQLSEIVGTCPGGSA